MLLAAATAAKLGDLEVITREELSGAQLTPPVNSNPLAEQDAPEARIVSGAPAPLVTAAPSPPPPALSYLPPSKTPLPIEQRPVTVAPPVIETEYLPPSPVVPLPAKPTTTGGIQVGVGGSYGGGSYGGGHYSGGVAGGIHYEQSGGKGDFFQGIKDSKAHLLGGVVGSKVAFIQGIKNAKEALFTGIKDSIAAKKEAFENLKGSKFSAGVQVYPVRPQPVYPPRPQVYPLPTYPEPTYPEPETTYPKPTYPQPTYPQPTYPQPTSPVYPQQPKPNPFAAHKAKVAAHWAAKKAKIDAWKQDIKNKFSSLFNKKQY